MKPLVCVPMGDPAGIAPEIIVRSIAESDVHDYCRLLVAGSMEYLKKASDICKVSLTMNECRQTGDARDQSETLNLYPVRCPPWSNTLTGRVSSSAGQTAYRCIEAATKLALQGKVDALATPPINKESIKAAGIAQAGHTEILAKLTDSPSPLTLFQVRNLRVFFLSRHVSLKDACDYITADRLYRLSCQALAALEQLGVSNPHLAVAALNPHGGEQGLFGNEEILSIKPAICRLQQDGYRVSGPYPADSVFHKALEGDYDGVVSLYHDQGHIATKMVDFQKTISMTCGLPFLRTSVDHGTAFDIAGKGAASPVSMIEAIRLAARYAQVMKAKRLTAINNPILKVCDDEVD